MTILEKIKFEEDWLSEVNLTKENIKIAFAGIRATALESQRWIPVSERLPEDGDPILFSTKTGKVYGGIYYKDGDGDNRHRQWYVWEDKNYAWDNVVIAWMPLPEPYKAESEG